mmetsp:Transcript_7826/g.10009  ORF Transcript_7826/g.10009 Transcript_7826/m.10009 type:complete len:110 (+) Transcript_7826:131-460(+)
MENKIKKNNFFKLKRPTLKKIGLKTAVGRLAMKQHDSLEFRKSASFKSEVSYRPGYNIEMLMDEMVKRKNDEWNLQRRPSSSQLKRSSSSQLKRSSSSQIRIDEDQVMT